MKKIEHRAINNTKKFWHFTLRSALPGVGLATTVDLGNVQSPTGSKVYTKPKVTRSRPCTNSRLQLLLLLSYPRPGTGLHPCALKWLLLHAEVRGWQLGCQVNKVLENITNNPAMILKIVEFFTWSGAATAVDSCHNNALGCWVYVNVVSGMG